MKLHNKFEIVQNGKIVARFYNQIFDTVFDCLQNYCGFAKYVALSGTYEGAQSELNGTTLENAIAIYAAQEHSYMLNPKFGPLQAIRKIVIPSGDLVGATLSGIGFCEKPQNAQNNQNVQICGICDTNLYNFAPFTDKNGQNQPIVKTNKELEIVSTIYLSWDQENEIMPLGGNNEFVKFLLGSNVYNGQAPTFDFGIGNDHRPNNIQVVQDYICQKQNIKENVTPTFTKTNGKMEISFTAQYSQQIYPFEIVLVANNKVVVRQNREQILSNSIVAETTTADANGRAALNNYCGGKITKVALASTYETIMETDEELASLVVEDSPAFVSDPKPNMFGENNDYDPSVWRVFESKCGTMLGFVSSDSIHIYKNINGKTQIRDSKSIQDPQTITDLQFFDDYLFAIKSVSPYVEMFKWKGKTLEPIELNLSGAIEDNANTFVFSNSNEQSISIGKDKQDNITIAIKFDANNIGIFLFKDSGTVCAFQEYHKPALTNIGVFGALVSNGTDEGYVVVSGVDNSTYFNCYKYSKNLGLQIISSSIMTNDWENNVESVVVGKNFIGVTRSVANYNVLWYFSSSTPYRIKPTDNTSYSWKFSKGGKLAVKIENSTKNFDLYYVKKEGAPIIFMSNPNQTYFAGEKQIAFFSNGCVVMRSTAPHTLYMDFGMGGYREVSGLPASTQVVVYTRRNLASYNKDNHQTYQLVLELEIEGEGND